MWVSDSFDQHAIRYEAWFEKHQNAYQAEVRALTQLMPATAVAVEIGVGTGRFAVPLGIRLGVDPSSAMLLRARERGVEAVLGVGEHLPFADSSFDLVLMVTTVCFLDDVRRAFLETHRILRPRGSIIVGLVDRESPVGKQYQERQSESVFYRLATFFSVDDIVSLLRCAGFQAFEHRQTLFGAPTETPASEPVKSGYGEGSFAVVRALSSGG